MTGVVLFLFSFFSSTDDTLSRDEHHVARADYRTLARGRSRSAAERSKIVDENRGGLFSPQFRVNRGSEIAIRCLQGFYCTVETRIELHRHADKHLVIESISRE